METYLVLLGREAALGEAELTCLLHAFDSSATVSTVAPSVVAVNPAELFDPAKWINRLGGSRLIARQLAIVPRITAEVLDSLLEPTVREVALSSQNLNSADRTKLLQGLKRLRPGLRYRPNNDPFLASGLSERLIRREDGAELLIIKSDKISVENPWIIAQVVAVQDARAWTDRDRGLPSVDPIAGLLPPKLARIMVNLAEPARSRGDSSPITHHPLLLDPFCGSGQIPIEALRLGWQVQASDLSKQAIESTETNLQWAIDHFGLDANQLLGIHQADIATIPESISSQSVDAIVTEPDLGPPLRAQSAVPSQEILAHVTQTVVAAFKTSTHCLRSGGRLVIVIPIIAGVRIFDRLDESARSGYILRETLHYARMDSRVEREIFVFDRT